MNSLAQNKGILLYVLAKAISLTGTKIQLVAIPLFILDKTGSATLMSLFIILCMVPAFIVTPLSGTMGDLYNKKTIMISTDIGRGIVNLVLVLLILFNKINITSLFISLVLVSVMDSMFNSASDSIIPDIVPEEMLTQANSLKSVSECIAMILGPVLGGILYGFWQLKAAIIFNTASFFISASLISLITYSLKHRRDQKLTARLIYSENKEVAKYIAKRGHLIMSLVITAVVNLFTMPILLVVLPFAVRKVIAFSAQQYGILEMFLMIGLLIGSVCIGTVWARTKESKLLKSGLLGISILAIVFSFVFYPSVIKLLGGTSWLNFCVISIFLIFIGMFNPLISIPIQTNLQKTVDSEIRSRFFSVFGLVSQSVIPLGSFIYGLLLDVWAVTYTVLLAGVVLLCFAGVIVSMGVNRTFEAGTTVNEEAM